MSYLGLFRVDFPFSWLNRNEKSWLCWRCQVAPVAGAMLHCWLRWGRGSVKKGFRSWNSAYFNTFVYSHSFPHCRTALDVRCTRLTAQEWLFLRHKINSRPQFLTLCQDLSHVTLCFDPCCALFVSILQVQVLFLFLVVFVWVNASKLIHVDSVLKRRSVQGGAWTSETVCVCESVSCVYGVSSEMHGSGVRSDMDVTACLLNLCIAAWRIPSL